MNVLQGLLPAVTFLLIALGAGVLFLAADHERFRRQLAGNRPETSAGWLNGALPAAKAELSGHRAE